ncbi:MAG: hypothetical protein ACRDQA_15665 [Nocardioidaceae bacterium]
MRTSEVAAGADRGGGAPAAQLRRRRGVGHDVPITIIAHDPSVMRRISGWEWQEGMNPGPDAPVWPMDTFRNRFLTAFGPRPFRTSEGH